MDVEGEVKMQEDGDGGRGRARARARGRWKMQEGEDGGVDGGGCRWRWIVKVDVEGWNSTE